MMRLFSIGAAGVAAMLSGCATAPQAIKLAAAQNVAAISSTDALPVATFIPESAMRAAIPSGFIGFCLRHSDQCDLPANAPTSMILTEQNWDLLNRVNRSFNASIRFVDDRKHYGVTDYWTIATDGNGDCDDFALTKRKALIDAGLPVAALRIAMVLTDAKEQHAVLTVTTDRGDFVLDNLSDEVRPWAALRYTWFERQDAKTSWRWDKVFADNSQAPDRR
jgi:predicted transglutaminase-like cysteine proteinase